MDKQKLKELINKNGGFAQIRIESLAGKVDNKNIKCEALSDKEREKLGVPEGAIFFKGIASNGDLNRNGYIITTNAWQKSIKDFMKNPVVLLGHDMDKPIGQCLRMEITDNGLYVEGFAFDDYTEGRFGRGLINAMSTGHIARKYDFINLRTGEVLTKTDFRRRWDEFRGLDEKDKNSLDNWVRRITETEILEFSLVSIPANRKSLITSREALESWHGQLGVVAKGNESEDNKNVTTNEMKEHTLTETDLERFPGLAEKYNAGDAISAKAWAEISGEKIEPIQPAKEDPKDTPAENPDETAGSDDTPAENADDGDDTATEGKEGAEGGDEKGDTKEGEGDEPTDPTADETNGDGEEGGESEEKVVLSKSARESLKEKATEAKEKAEKLAKLVEKTTSEEEDEEAQTPAKEPVKTEVTINLEGVEKFQKVFTDMLGLIENQQEQIDNLTKVLEKVPEKKGLMIHNQFSSKSESEEKQEKTKEKVATAKKEVEEVAAIFEQSGLGNLFQK